MNFRAVQKKSILWKFANLRVIKKVAYLQFSYRDTKGNFRLGKRNEPKNQRIYGPKNNICLPTSASCLSVQCLHGCPSTVVSASFCISPCPLSCLSILAVTCLCVHLFIHPILLHIILLYKCRFFFFSFSAFF